MFAWDLELCAGCWPPNQRNTTVLNSPPPPHLQNYLQEPASTGRPHLKFPPVCLLTSCGAGSSQMSMTAVVLARLPQKSRPVGLPLGPPTPARASQTPRGRFGSTDAAAWAQLCAPTSQEEAANLQIPARTRQLPSARKLLLIKPVHLITGRSIKCFSRCFRCSLWALVKAGEASDQGGWPCGAGAGSPLAWTRPAPSAAQSALAHLLCRLAKARSVITKVKKTSL